MLRCGATWDENRFPLGQGGTFRGFLTVGTNPHRHCATAVAAVEASQAFTPSQGGDFQGALHDPIRDKD
jgi:hypothetical protein